MCVNDNGSAVESLIEELKSEETELKEEVIYALWQIGTERAIEGLNIALEDKDKFIRKLSIRGTIKSHGRSRYSDIDRSFGGFGCLGAANRSYRAG